MRRRTRLGLALMGLLALATAASAAGAADRGPAGRYRLTGEQDAASELIIRKDGHFAYGLIVGALDEQAEGRWRRQGDALYLTTEPKPVPPVFAAGAAGRTDEVPLRVRVVWDGSDRGVAGVDLRVGFADGGAVDDYTQEDGWSLPPEERRTPAWVELSLPMFGLGPARFPIAPGGANALTFALIRNDIGIYDFENMRVDIAKDRLVMHRGEARLVYQRVGK